MSDVVLRYFADASDIVGGAVGEVGDASGVGFEVGEIVVIVVRIALWIIGVLAVAMIIYGGARYVMSQGDSSKATSARNTIIYAAVGLVVAILAYAIVGFVVDNVGSGGGETETEEVDDGGAET